MKASNKSILGLTMFEAKRLRDELDRAIRRAEDIEDEEEFAAACQEEAEAHYLNEEIQKLKGRLNNG